MSEKGIQEAKKSSHDSFEIALEQVQDLEFRVKFDGDNFPDLTMDEPPPVGGDQGPNATRLLAAAIGNCLSASLLFCLRKSRVDIQSLRAVVRIELGRNEKGRMRIGKIEVDIEPKISEEEKQKAKRCLQLFEDFCIVTQSVREGIDVKVAVKQ